MRARIDRSAFTIATQEVRQVQTVKPSAVKLQTTPRVKLDIRAGLNDKGKESRSYVQQITGPNKDKTPSASGQVYDWLIVNAGKPGSNFSKLGRTEADTEGHYRNRFELGDGIYRVVRPNESYSGWPETVFLKVHAGKVARLEMNEARAAVGLAPVAIAKAKTSRLEEDDEAITV